jgi:hypothetical protein
VEYDKKLALIEQANAQWRADPERFAFLYGDEFTFFRPPRVGFAYAAKGAAGLKAIGVGTQTRRIAACLDIMTGAVIARQRNSFSVQEMYLLLPLRRAPLSQGGAHLHCRR